MVCIKDNKNIENGQIVEMKMNLILTTYTWVPLRVRDDKDKPQYQ